MNENVLIIGAGRVGTTFAKVLSEIGYEIPYILSNEYLENFELYLSGTVPIKEIKKSIIENTEIIIISVPDDQIHNVVNKLNSITINWKNKIILHTSGCLSSIELNSLKKNGAKVGSMHPLQTFDSYFLDRKIFRDIVLTVEGDNQAILFAEKIAKQLNMNLLKLKHEDKIGYHIAAVASSNFIVALLDYTERLYNELAIDRSKSKNLILPIVNQTIKNYFENETKQIITGPLKRNDVKTVEKHINYLKENQKDLLPVYKEISKYISQFILKQSMSDKKKLNEIIEND